MSANPEHQRRVFVGSIQETVTEIRAAAICYGRITAFHYAPSSRGWALITFSAPEEAAAAIAGMDGKPVFTAAPVVARIAHEKKNDTSPTFVQHGNGTLPPRFAPRRYPVFIPAVCSQHPPPPLPHDFLELRYSRPAACVGCASGGAPYTPSHMVLLSNGPHLTGNEWLAYNTHEGQPYYVNLSTRQTQWERPCSLLPQYYPAHFPFTPRPPPQIAHIIAQPPVHPVPPVVQNSSHVNEALGARKYGPPGSNLFVFHIPSEWNHADLYEHFKFYGTVISARVKTDATNRNLGFGFVSYDSPEASVAAIKAMHGFHVNGKWLKVTLKKGEEHLLPDHLRSLYSKSGTESKTLQHHQHSAAATATPESLCQLLKETSPTSRSLSRSETGGDVVDACPSYETQSIVSNPLLIDGGSTNQNMVSPRSQVHHDDMFQHPSAKQDVQLQQACGLPHDGMTSLHVESRNTKAQSLASLGTILDFSRDTADSFHPTLLTSKYSEHPYLPFPSPGKDALQRHKSSNNSIISSDHDNDEPFESMSYLHRPYPAELSDTQAKFSLFPEVIPARSHLDQTRSTGAGSAQLMPATKTLPAHRRSSPPRHLEPPTVTVAPSRSSSTFCRSSALSERVALRSLQKHYRYFALELLKFAVRRNRHSAIVAFRCLKNNAVIRHPVAARQRHGRTWAGGLSSEIQPSKVMMRVPDQQHTTHSHHVTNEGSCKQSHPTQPGHSFQRSSICYTQKTLLRRTMHDERLSSQLSVEKNKRVLSRFVSILDMMVSRSLYQTYLIFMQALKHRQRKQQRRFAVEAKVWVDILPLNRVPSERIRFLCALMSMHITRRRAELLRQSFSQWRLLNNSFASQDQLALSRFYFKADRKRMACYMFSLCVALCLAFAFLRHCSSSMGESNPSGDERASFLARCIIRLGLRQSFRAWANTVFWHSKLRGQADQQSANAHEFPSEHSGQYPTLLSLEQLSADGANRQTYTPEDIWMLTKATLDAVLLLSTRFLNYTYEKNNSVAYTGYQPPSEQHQQQQSLSRSNPGLVIDLADNTHKDTTTTEQSAGSDFGSEKRTISGLTNPRHSPCQQALASDNKARPALSQAVELSPTQHLRYSDPRSTTSSKHSRLLGYDHSCTVETEYQKSGSGQTTVSRQSLLTQIESLRCQLSPTHISEEFPDTASKDQSTRPTPLCQGSSDHPSSWADYIERSLVSRLMDGERLIKYHRSNGQPSFRYVWVDFNDACLYWSHRLPVKNSMDLPERDLSQVSTETTGKRLQGRRSQSLSRFFRLNRTTVSTPLNPSSTEFKPQGEPTAAPSATVLASPLLGKHGGHCLPLSAVKDVVYTWSNSPKAALPLLKRADTTGSCRSDADDTSLIQTCCFRTFVLILNSDSTSAIPHHRKKSRSGKQTGVAFLQLTCLNDDQFYIWFLGLSRLVRALRQEPPAPLSLALTHGTDSEKKQQFRVLLFKKVRRAMLW